MKSVVQRVSRAEIRVEGRSIANIGRGLLVLVGVEKGDGEADAVATGRKIAGLRLFPGRTPMDVDLAGVGGACIVVSQFTLLGSVRKGKRPGFDTAEKPARAESLYLRVAQEIQNAGIEVQTGRFGAMMDVDLVNDGPVTLLVCTRDGAIL
jgi:D-tyrosyl-tRNA(Tyr) deacylase